MALRVSRRGASPLCSRQEDCVCVACFEGASACVSLNSGELILRLKGSHVNGGSDHVFGRRLLENDPFAAQPWRLAELVVDTPGFVGYWPESVCGNYWPQSVFVEFPTTVFKNIRRSVYFHRVRKPDQEGEWCRALGLYAPPQKFYAEHAKLMQSVSAEANRQARLRDRWWRGRALALALGTQERIGERSPIRMLTPDAFRAILAMVRAAGPASEAEYHADYPGRPSYSLDPGKWSDGAASAAEGGGSAASEVGSRSSRRKATGLCRIHSGVCSLF